MSTKALKTELIAAIAMILVAILALSGSTYAWFASNNTVTATGMQVTATAEGGLLIAHGIGITDNSKWLSSATAGMGSATVLYPTSTSPEAVNSTMSSMWVHAKAGSYSVNTGSDGSYDELTLSISGAAMDSKQYFVMEPFSIKSASSEDVTNLIVSGVNVSGNSKPLSNSLRVAIACDDKVAVYAPVYSATTGTRNTKVATSISTTGTALTWANVTTNYSDEDSEVLAATVTENTPIVVRVYIWFEGEDQYSTSVNAAESLDTIMVSVVFEGTLPTT